MGSIIEKLISNKSPLHFIAYCLSYMVFGSIISSLGPLIPYLSQKTGRNETQYSFLFLCRSIGFILGALAIKLLEKILEFHNILIIASYMLLILLGTFCFILNIAIQGILVFFISFFCCFLDIILTVCVLQTQKNGNIQFWMLILHGMFGIGGLMGPIFVSIFQIDSCAVLGIAVSVVIPFYWILKTPQDHRQIQQQLEHQGVLEQIKYVGYEGISHLQKHIEQNDQFQLSPQPSLQKSPQKCLSPQPLQPLKSNILLLLYFMNFLSVGLQVSYGSWISTYAVLQGIATKQQATRYSTYYWISVTISIFLISCGNSGAMKKLFVLGQMLVGSCVATVLMIWFDQRQMACIFGSILFGICLSAILPLLFTVSQEYNFQISATQSANFMIFSVIGQGALTTLMGYLIKWLFNDVLFYMMLLMAMALMVSIYFLEKMLIEQRRDSQQNQFNDQR